MVIVNSFELFYICKKTNHLYLFTMVNVEEFTNRLNTIMDFYDLSAASFADKIEVGRSSISHLLSGRNKPSLDFVMKIVKAFPEVELYWLLNGKGTFPKKATTAAIENRESGSNPETKMQDLFSPSTPNPEDSFHNKVPSTGKKIKKIVLFYSDGTFDAYEN